MSNDNVVVYHGPAVVGVAGNDEEGLDVVVPEVGVPLSAAARLHGVVAI